MTLRVVLAIEVGDPTIVLGDTIRMYVEGLEALSEKLVQHEVVVCPFASQWIVGYGECPNPGESLCMRFKVGEFEVKKIEENLVRLCAIDSVAGLCMSFQSLWNSLDDVCMKQGERVVVIARTTNFGSVPFTLQQQSHQGGVSIVIIGDLEEKYIASLQSYVASTGGFLFPNVQDPHSFAQAMGNGVAAFIGLKDDDIRARSSRFESVNKRTDSVYEVDDMGSFRLSPGQHLRRALLQDPSEIAFRWTRGIRTVREKHRGIRDVVCCESTPLGLELSPPDGSGCWRVLRTHPPISGLGIQDGSFLISINGHQVNKNRDQTIRALSQRPLSASLLSPIEQKESHYMAWVNSISEEVCAYINNLRAVKRKPFQQIPFTSSELMDLLSDFTEENDPPVTSLDQHPIHTPSTFREFIKNVAAVTPASLVHAPEIARKLYSEGFPFEFLYVKMILSASLSLPLVPRQLPTLCIREGILSIWWLRIFLTLITGVRVDNSSDLLEQALNETSLDKITPQLIQSSAHIPVTAEWVRKWNTYENLFS